MNGLLNMGVFIKYAHSYLRLLAMQKLIDLCVFFIISSGYQESKNDFQKKEKLNFKLFKE